jgi:hypothetical protein
MLHAAPEHLLSRDLRAFYRFGSTVPGALTPISEGAVFGIRTCTQVLLGS